MLSFLVSLSPSLRLSLSFFLSLWASAKPTRHCAASIECALGVAGALEGNQVPLCERRS